MTRSTSPRVATLSRVSMLHGTLELHDVRDVEALCRTVLHDHLATGKRTANGGTTGPSSLSDHDFEDALAYLVTIAWKASERFDGRGRFSGYLVQLLHRRIVDWKRERFGSTRYTSRPIVELTSQDRELVATITDLTEPEILDLVNTIELSHPARTTLRRIVIPLVLEHRSIEDYADRSGIPIAQINRDIGRLRRELETKQLLAA